jgi:hypothetical protein
MFNSTFLSSPDLSGLTGILTWHSRDKPGLCWCGARVKYPGVRKSLQSLNEVYFWTSVMIEEWRVGDTHQGSGNKFYNTKNDTATFTDKLRPIDDKKL